MFKKHFLEVLFGVRRLLATLYQNGKDLKKRDIV